MKTRMFVLLVLTLSIEFSYSSSGQFTENFLSAQYKDTTTTTASWGFSGMTSLSLNSNALGYLSSAGGDYSVESIVMKDNYVYVSCGTNNVNNFVVFDISNPSNISQVGIINATGGTQGKQIVVNDTAVYQGTWSGGTKVIDITSKTNPVVVGTAYSEAGYVHGLAIKDNTTMFGSTYNQCYVGAYNVSGSTVPRGIASVQLPVLYGTKLTYSNNHCYLSNAGYGETFFIVDVTSPGAPTLKGSLDLYSDSGMRANRILGSYAFVASSIGDTILRCIDVSNPQNPVQVNVLKSAGAGGGVNSINIWGNYAFLSSYAGGNKTFVVDISDTADMDTVSIYSFGITWYEFGLHNGYLFLCNPSPKLYRILFNGSGTLQSKTVASSSFTIAGATLSVSETVPANTSISYYLTANGGTNWEGPVTNGTRWSFVYPGSDLRWKAVLSSSDSGYTPVLYGINITYVDDVGIPSWNGDLTLKTYQTYGDTEKYSAVVSWNAVSDSSNISYVVQQKQNNTDWVHADTINVISYTFINQSNTISYKYRVKAVDPIGNANEWKEISDENAPDWTPNLRVIDNGISNDGTKTTFSMTAKWDNAKDNIGDILYYEVQFRESSETEWGIVAFSQSVNYEKTGLDVDKQYKLRVRARDVAGNFTAWTEVDISTRFSSKDVDATGGKVSIDDLDGNAYNDASIEVPAGAITRKLTFRILRQTDEVYECKAIEPSTGKTLGKVLFKKPVIITIPYKKDIIRMAGWDESQLGIYYYDGVDWIAIGGIVDKVNSVVRAKVFHFTMFKVGKVRSSNTNEFSVSVNPAVITPNDDGINDEARFNIVLSDDLLDADGTITIYDINGKIVRIIKTQGATSVTWDGREETGKLSESGIYIYKVAISDKKQTGSISIAK